MEWLAKDRFLYLRRGAVVVYELPSGTILKYDEGKIIADGRYTILN